MKVFSVFCLVLLLVLPVVCGASSGGSGYQERDRSGWFQSKPSVGGGGLLAPSIGGGWHELGKDREAIAGGVEPVDTEKSDFVLKYFPWSVFALVLVFGAVLLFVKISLERLNAILKAKLQGRDQ